MLNEFSALISYLKNVQKILYTELCYFKQKDVIKNITELLQLCLLHFDIRFNIFNY